MKRIIPFIAILIATSSCSSQTKESESYHRVDNAEWELALKSADESPQIIDVRTPEEFDAGNIQESVNVDFLADGFIEKMSAFDKDETVYIYCQSGGRSARASEQLAAEGFKDIVELKVGYSGYDKK